MPQFDFASFAPQIVWLAITFVIFYFLMARLALPKIGEVLEERDEKIADDLDQAEGLRREAGKVQDTFETTLASARADAMKTVQAARDKAMKDMDQKTRALDAKLAEQAAEAEKRIAAEKAKAMAELESVAADACSEIAKRLLGDTVAGDEIAGAVKAELAARGRA